MSAVRCDSLPRLNESQISGTYCWSRGRR